MSTNNIRLNNVSPNVYKPTKLRIDSIGVGLSDETNDALRLTDTQHMIVGERLITSGDSINKTYGLVVDKEGIAINTSLPDRARLKGQYAMYVDGSVFINGAVVACNILAPGVSLSNATLSNFGDAYWKMASFESDNIFYENKITLGADSSARHNAHPLSIVQSADRTINHAQISIQNTQTSQIRLGIIGTSNVSPAIFNTSTGVPIEFHASRNQSYFDTVYTRSYYENGSLITVPSEVPRYGLSNISPPNLIIAANGVVGVNTSFNPVLTYQIRTPYPGSCNVMSFPTKQEQMIMHVDGPLFASNILIQDYESGKPVNIDRLYVRREGVTFLANQIIPGPFANGVYTFQSNIAIAGDAEEAFELKVHGSERITDYLQVDGFSRMNKIEVNDAVLLDVASFCNDVYMQRDVIVKESLRLRGGLFTEVIDGDNTYWCNVQFTAAGSSLSNINLYGQGFTTPGRVGVGIDPRVDEVNNQLVVRKRFDDIYELELFDKSDSKLYKAAFIGHPLTGPDRVNDGSLVFSTPAARNSDFNLAYTQSPQNFYFFPGQYTNRTESLVTSNNPPILNVHHTKAVGILTYDPAHTLDVRGDIGFTGDIYQGNDRLGVWRDKTYPNIYVSGGTTPLFRGLEYNNPLNSNVGVNMQPDPRYGMVVAGKLKSIDGYFTADDREIVPWIDSATAENLVAPATTSSMFTFRNVGVGIKTPTATVDLRNNNGRATILRLNSPDRNIEYKAMNQIHFAGLNDPWIIQGNDEDKILEFGYGPCNMRTTDKKAMFMVYSTVHNKHQVVVGGRQDYLQGVNIPDPSASLHVDGGLSVNGNVSITGRYIINGVTLSNATVEGSNPPVLTNDDVFIGGNRIFLNPRITSGTANMVAVNFTSDRLGSDVENASRAPFRVFNNDSTNPVIARFVTSSGRGLIEFVSTQAGNRNVRMGFETDGSFTCQDASGRAYFNISSNVSGQTFVAFNAVEAPTASLHIQSSQSGSNMLRLTRRGAGDDATGLAPQFELEKKIDTVSGLQTTRWVLHGPDATFQQKLSLRYGEGGIGSANEVFCFTNNGCIGIGNSAPEFALDVKASGKRGTMRLHSDTVDPVPQIILQSGVFGSDAMTDYRIYSQSNKFIVDSINSTTHRELLHFDESGRLGVGTAPSSNYQMNVSGILNVSQAILLNGSPLFDTEGSDAQEGFSIRAINIFMRPRTELGGGIVVNRNFATCNLFHIFNGENANMMVYDSTDNEAQVHFRTATIDGATSYSMYRMAMSNQTFRLAHQPNSPSNASYVPDDYNGYCNVVAWGPSTRVGEYDMNLNGSLALLGATPSLVLRDGNTSLSSSNQALFIRASNGVGISTSTPQAELHILQTRSNVPSLLVEQPSGLGASNLARFASGGVDRFVIRSNGTVGLGTTLPQAPLHVIDTIRVSDSTGIARGQVVFGDANVGIGRGLSVSTLTHANDAIVYNTSTTGSIGFVTNSVERLRITPSGNVGIGTSNPACLMHLHASNVATNTQITQLGTGDILQLYGSNTAVPSVIVRQSRVGINTASPDTALHVVGAVKVDGDILPSATNTYNLGSSNMRWKDIFVSANSIDLGGTRISRAPASEEGFEGDLEIRDVGVTNELRSLVVNKVRLKSNNPLDTREVYLEQGTSDPFVFVSYDTVTEERVEFAPFSKSSTSGGISIGVDTPSALLHIASPSESQPTAVFDHTGTASNVFQVQSGGIDKFLVQRNGNVGVGTSFAAAPFYVYGSNLAPQTLARVHQGGTGNILTLGTTAHGVTTVFDGLGNVGIGTTLPLTRLHVKGEQLFDGDTVFREKVYAAKDVEVQGNTITHGDTTTDSDIRLKKDLTKITDALDKVCMLTGYTFTKITSNRRSTGLVAQEVQEVLPEAVYVRDDTQETLGVAYGNMMGLIIEAIKELKEDVQTLKDIVLKK